MRGKEEDAPIPVVRETTIEPQGSTLQRLRARAGLAGTGPKAAEANEPNRKLLCADCGRTPSGRPPRSRSRHCAACCGYHDDDPLIPAKRAQVRRALRIDAIPRAPARARWSAPPLSAPAARARPA